MRRHDWSIALLAVLLALAVLWSLPAVAAMRMGTGPAASLPWFAESQSSHLHWYGLQAGSESGRCAMVSKRDRLWGHRIKLVRRHSAAPVAEVQTVLHYNTTPLHLPLAAAASLVTQRSAFPRGP